MATINIPDSTLQRLTEVAAAMRIPLDKLLDGVAAESAGRLGGRKPAQPGTPEWTKAFDDWVASHPPRSFVADDSRDSIYGDERD